MLITFDAFIVTGYIPAEKGKLCSENDNVAVNYLEHCKEAAKQLKRNFTEEEEKYYCRGCPNGCYSNADNHVYFNAKSTYRQTIFKNKTQICYAAGDFKDILLYHMII